MSKVKFISSNDRAVLLALEEAAQEIADKVALLREVLKEDALVRLSNTHQQNVDEYREQAGHECADAIRARGEE
jgi:hypothetical protein